MEISDPAEEDSASERAPKGRKSDCDYEEKKKKKKKTMVCKALT